MKNTVKLSNLSLIVYDFDGVMTNNKVYMDETGKELVQVNRADGLGISEIKKLGIKQIILSTEKNLVVATRAKKLGIPCIHGVDNKKNILMEFCAKNFFNLKNVAYVGNDINDLEAMEIVNMKFCPSDAHNSIKKIADYVLESNGGDGVIRELLDFIIKQKGE